MDESSGRHGSDSGSDRYQRYAALRLERPCEGVLEIVLDNPGRRNAVDAAMHAALADIWVEVDQDPAVRAVVISGAGEAFSAGGDLDMARRIHDDEQWRLRLYRETRDLVHNMVRCSKPVVSAIEGPAVGAGAAAALLADISVAGESARIMDGHTRIGVAGGDHAAIIWPLLCGMAKAKYYLLTCEPLTGREAERIGLVSLSVPDGSVRERALAIARDLAGGPQPALRWTKSVLNGWLQQAAPIFDASVALEMLSFTGRDAVEGIDAVRERRQPRWPSAGPGSDW